MVHFDADHQSSKASYSKDKLVALFGRNVACLQLPLCVFKKKGVLVSGMIEEF